MQSKREVQPVIKTLAEFDAQSGNIIERALFNHRLWVLLICLIITGFLGYQATRLELNASFEKMIPLGHPYIGNYLKHKDDLKGLGNAIRVAVETTRGDIYTAEYLDTLQRISQDLFLMPGVERNFLKSLWTPSTRWNGVTEEGFEAGPVIPSTYNGSPQSLEQVRMNVDRSGEIGQLVAPNLKSSIVYVPLMSLDPATGKTLNYGVLSDRLEQIRSKYENETIKIHITGFAKVMGDLIHGVRFVIFFFGIATVICALFLFLYTKCLRSTMMVVVCSLVGVIWQMGLSPLLGFDLNPYSVLVPFLVFAIGMSHGAQKMNGIMQDIGRGTHKAVAARYTFRRLFIAGLTALISDAVGFAVLMTIKIQVIQELAIIASTGVAALIFTQLILLPILLSYTGVSRKSAEHSLQAETEGRIERSSHLTWQFLDLFTRRNWALAMIVASLLLAGIGYRIGAGIKIGDLDPGAPELRADSRYNRDAAFMNSNFGASSDVFAIMVETPKSLCTSYDTMMRMDALEWELRNQQGVEFTQSLALYCRQTLYGFNEGNINWYELLKNQGMINSIAYPAPRIFFNDDCSLLTLYIYLADHKADTLSRVVDTVEAFAKKNDTPNARFLMAAGSAGIAAATNIVVEKADRKMLYLVYAAVIILCFIAFRSWRAVTCAILPLMLTSILANALMVELGIGVKVATLPVIALGVGVGVDYALYLISVLKGHLDAGRTLSEAYYRSLLFTGRIIILIGITLSLAVATWAFSPIKFQADMGILLGFMFMLNMLGTMLLLPALAYFLMPSRVKQEHIQLCEIKDISN
jgi:predicted RND superfamily exporter protein